jgi:fructokinase
MSLQILRALPVVVVGEVLWDLFPHAMRLGGAPLNFGAHAVRLGHEVCLVSAVGLDSRGRAASEQIAALGVDTAFLQTTALPTGTAVVEVQGDRTSFSIPRPAAYDAVSLSDRDIERLRGRQPGWLYYGTLFASTREGRLVLDRLMNGLGNAHRFYDVNLRPGFDSPQLVEELLRHANVVKLNEEEVGRVHGFAGLPPSTEAFCREGASRYGWKAVAVTRGARGCGVLVNGEYLESAGYPVDVADPVGAGDAFAAAFMHGLGTDRPLEEIAAFANRVGALVASRHGAIPDWTPAEAVNR